MTLARERFSEPWMVALVLEPEKHRGGFFCERNGHVSPNSPVEFFELLERNSRDSVLAWENYNAVDPSTSSAPVLSETNTATLGVNSSAEIQAARTAKSRKVLPKRSGLRRALFTLGLVLGLLGLGAVAFVKRATLRTWIRENVRWQTAPSPVPSPNVTPLRVQPSSSPDQIASPVPTQSSASQPESPLKQEASPAASSSPHAGAHPGSTR